MSEDVRPEGDTPRAHEAYLEGIRYARERRDWMFLATWLLVGLILAPAIEDMFDGQAGDRDKVGAAKKRSAQIDNWSELKDRQ